MIRTLYRYDRATGQLIEPVDIDFIDGYPLEYWTLPELHTAEPPPKYSGKDECPVWDGKAWVKTPLSAFDPPAPTLDEVKSQKIGELDMLWRMKMQEGLVTSTGVKVKCEVMDLFMFQIGLQKASKAGSLALLRDYEGKLHRNVPASDVATICLELDSYVQLLWTRKVLLQEKANLCKTVESVSEITWETEITV